MKGVLLAFENFKDSSRNMNRLSGRTFSSEAEFSRADSVIKEMRKAFLNKGGIYLVHSIGEGDRSLIGEVPSI